MWLSSHEFWRHTWNIYNGYLSLLYFCVRWSSMQYQTFKDGILLHSRAHTTVLSVVEFQVWWSKIRSHNFCYHYYLITEFNFWESKVKLILTTERKNSITKVTIVHPTIVSARNTSVLYIQNEAKDFLKYSCNKITET